MKLRSQDTKESRHISQKGAISVIKNEETNSEGDDDTDLQIREPIFGPSEGVRRRRFDLSKHPKSITILLAVVIVVVFMLINRDTFIDDMAADLVWDTAHPGRYRLLPIENVSGDVKMIVNNILLQEEYEIKAHTQQASRDSKVRNLADKLRHEERDRLKVTNPMIARMDEQDELAGLDAFPYLPDNVGRGTTFNLFHLAYLAPREGVSPKVAQGLYDAAINTTSPSNYLAYGIDGISWLSLATVCIPEERRELRLPDIEVKGEVTVAKAMALFNSLSEEFKERVHLRGEDLRSFENIRTPPMLGISKTTSSPDLLARLLSAPAPKVLLFTTLFTPKKLTAARKIRSNEAQFALVKSMADMRPEIDLVVFTEDPFWLEYCAKHDIMTVSPPRNNAFNLPIIRDMYIKIERDILRPETKLFGYINSDIILDRNSLITTVDRILADAGISTKATRPHECSWLQNDEPYSKEIISAPRSTCSAAEELAPFESVTWDERRSPVLQAALPELQPRMLVTGRRTLVPPLKTNEAGSHKFMRQLKYSDWVGHQMQRGELEYGYCLDYFLVSKTAFNWTHEVPDCVIARAGFDNWFSRWARMNAYPNSMVDWQILKSTDHLKSIGFRWVTHFSARHRASLGDQSYDTAVPDDFPDALLPPPWHVPKDRAVSLIDVSKTVIALHITHPKGGHLSLDTETTFSHNVPQRSRQDIGFNNILVGYIFTPFALTPPYFTKPASLIRKVQNKPSTKRRKVECVGYQPIASDLRGFEHLSSPDQVEIVKCFMGDCICRYSDIMIKKSLRSLKVICHDNSCFT